MVRALVRTIGLQIDSFVFQDLFSVPLAKMCGAHIIDASAAKVDCGPSTVAVFGGSIVPGDGYIPPSAVGYKWTNEHYICQGVLARSMKNMIHNPVPTKASRHESVSVLSSGDDDEEDTNLVEGI